MKLKSDLGLKSGLGASYTVTAVDAFGADIATRLSP